MFEPSDRQNKVLRLLAWTTGCTVTLGGCVAASSWLPASASPTDWAVLAAAWLVLALVGLIVVEHSYKLYHAILGKLAGRGSNTPSDD